MTDQLEHRLLKLLEEKVREMFEFTGWDEDVDEEPCLAVRAVEKSLADLDAWRQVVRATDPTTGNTDGK